jgi:hypothetical protein
MTPSDAATLKDYADYKSGNYKPDAKTTNQLMSDSYSIGKKANLDVTSGSPADIRNRIHNHIRNLPNATKSNPSKVSVLKKVAGRFQK